VTIAVQSDVEAVLLRPLTANESTYIAALLAKADGLIFGELPGWKFNGLVNDAAIDLIGTGSFEVWLPGRPVMKVESVTLDGALLPASYYSWHAFGDLAREAGGWWYDRIGGGYPAVWPRGSTVHVVYDYGLAAPPSELVSVAADLVRVGITSPSSSNVQSQRFDDYAITYAMTSAQTAMRTALDDYRSILDHYRYPVAI
jgi:hypothetical protein